MGHFSRTVTGVMLPFHRCGEDVLVVFAADFCNFAGLETDPQHCLDDGKRWTALQQEQTQDATVASPCNGGTSGQDTSFLGRTLFRKKFRVVFPHSEELSSSIGSIEECRLLLERVTVMLRGLPDGLYGPYWL